LLDDRISFTVASARSVVSMRPMLKGLKLHLPVIEFNGSFISDLESGHHYVINDIDVYVADDVYQLITKSGCVPFISTFDGTEDCLYYDAIINEGMQWYLDDRTFNHDRRLRSTTDLGDSLRDKVVCLTVIDRPERTKEVQAAVEATYSKSIRTQQFESIYSPGWSWLTFHDSRATKAQAIRTVLADYGLSEAELVVFGDGSNDVDMFLTADRAIAVANATEELKSCATQTIGVNSEDSVAKFIRDDWHNLRQRLTCATERE
jgi:HAD superfamily hydrolase (TIGR01484 family)